MLSAYLPQDRWRALASGLALPKQTSGAALIADISGFTPLSDALVRSLGSRRGAEELAAQLNRIYGALIAEVERYGGSVIDFSGDAITCWFDAALGSAAPAQASVVERALAAALAMQGALAALGMVHLPSGGVVVLAMKIGIASGPALRLRVGDPAVQLLDVLAGETLDRMAGAEQVASRAEIVLSPECYALLGERVLVVEWRNRLAGSAEERYPVIGGLLTPVAPCPWPALPPSTLADPDLRPWLLPAVYERYLAGGESAPELRPVTALFLGFGGIDYEHDPDAEARLDGFVGWVQGVVASHGGALIQFTIGDKGSYMFIAFGAFAAREDDARHAVDAALELRDPPASSAITPRIGISQGIMYSGAYGSASRRTHGALGDEANLAARLMQAARPGQVLVSGRIQHALAQAFRWDLLPSILVKGKRAPVPAARLVGAASGLPATASYEGALVGRAAELASLRQALLPIFSGQFGGVVAIAGEAGAGKSRLAFELRRELTRDHALRWLSCPAGELASQPLRVFRYLLRAYFAQDAALPPDACQARFDAAFAALIGDLVQRGTDDLAAELMHARPFLAALVDLRWEGSAYEAADPAQRLASSFAALKALLSAESLRQPVIVHVEDAQALDESSRTLINLLAYGAHDYPFALLLTSRYRDDGRPAALDLDPAVPLTTLRLQPLARAEIHALACDLLAGSCSDELADLLSSKTRGNALFAEQLTLDLRERGALSCDASGLWGLTAQATIEVPATITAVLIARLDRLPASLRGFAQMAAVLGQEFDMRVLARMLDDGDTSAAQLWQGHAEGLWLAVDEQRWRFRHPLLRDAAYDMQLSALLRELHGRAALAIRQVYGAALASQIADLVQHFRQAGDAASEGQYLTILAEQAYDSSHFREAIVSLQRAMALLAPAAGAPFPQRARLGYRLARVFLQLGDERAAEEQLAASLASATELGDDLAAADASYDLGTLRYRRADHGAALAYLERSLEHYRATSDRTGEARALNQLGSVYIALDDEASALACYEQALALPRGAGGRRR